MMTRDQALVESSTCSEYCLVRREKLGIEGGDAVLPVIGQGCSGIQEIGEGFLDVAALDFRKSGGFFAFRNGFQDIEKPGIEGEGGVEIGYFRQQAVEGFALGGVVRDGIEMVETPPTAGEGFGGVLKGEIAGPVGGPGGGLGRDFLDSVLRFSEGVTDGGDDGFRGEGGPFDLEGGV